MLSAGVAVEGISDRAAGRSLSRSLTGKGAFLRIRNYERHPGLIPAWQSLLEAWARARAVHWLVGEGLLADVAACRFMNDHPEPALP